MALGGVICTWLSLAATVSAQEQEVPGSSVAIPALRIALLNDIYIAAEGDGESLFVLKQSIEQINDSSIDIVLIAGGLTADGSKGALESFVQLREHLAPPTYVVPGPTDIPYSNDDMQETMYRDTVGRGYFAVRIAPDLQLIGLNGPVLLRGGDAAEAHWQWLEHALASPFDGYRVLLTSCMHGQSAPSGSVDGTAVDAPNQRLNGLIETHAIDLIVCGSHVTDFGAAQSGRVLAGPPANAGPVWMLVEYVPGQAPRHDIRILRDGGPVGRPAE